MVRSACALVAVGALACATQAPVVPAPVPAEPAPMVSATPTVLVPATRREAIVDVIHGKQVADPYRWLERVDEQEVQKWMAEQDAAARGYLRTLPGRDALRKRLEELTYIDFTSPPYRRGDRFFYSRAHADKEKSITYFRVGRDGEERVLIDPNKLSDDGSVSLRGTSPSPEGKLLAYKLSRNNADTSTMYLRDIDSGVDSKIDVIDGVRYGFASWTADGKGFIYTWVPEDAPRAELLGHARIRYHAVGSDPTKDPVVLEPSGDPATFVAGWISQDGHWMIVSKGRGEFNELYYKDLRKKAGLFGPLEPLATGMKASFSVDTFHDRFYVTTDEDAPRQRVFAVDPKRPDRGNWREIVPQADDQLIGAYVVGGHLVTNYMRNAYTSMQVRNLDGVLVRDVEVPSIGDIGGMMGREDDDAAYFTFSSFTQTPTIYETSMASGKSDVWGELDIPVDTTKFETEQVWYPSKDGTKVSMFIVKPKGIELDGSHPVLLYGYGGFSSSMTPDFSVRAALWAERGGIYAMPNLRGGGEYGEPWHQAGMLDRKQNVFDDFIGAAEYLIAKKYTSPRRLAIMGGSNGGLLVGAAMVQRPELFRAVVCSVPLLDMLRYHEFGSGSTWIPEYGDPRKAEEFAYLRAYSPYHNVVHEVAYPALLMESADSDDRVDPMHARKFVAAIQAASTSGHPAILRIEKNAGHGGAGMRRAAVDKSVDGYSFLFEQLGM